MSTKKSSRKISNESMTVVSDAVNAVSITNTRDATVYVVSFEIFKDALFSKILASFDYSDSKDAFLNALSHTSTAIEFEIDEEDFLTIQSLTCSELIQLIDNIPSLTKQQRLTTNKNYIYTCCFHRSFVNSDKELSDAYEKFMLHKNVVIEHQSKT